MSIMLRFRAIVTACVAIVCSKPIREAEGESRLRVQTKRRKKDTCPHFTSS